MNGATLRHHVFRWVRSEGGPLMVPYTAPLIYCPAHLLPHSEKKEGAEPRVQFLYRF